VARGASETRERLLTTAQHLFARDGIYQVPLKRIVEGAGQRNPSALHYHFGGRDGLLHAIILRHDQRIQAERHQMLADLEREGRSDDLRALVLALVEPFSHELDTNDGREYLQIVSQLSTLFDFWDIDLPSGPTETQRMFLSMSRCLPHLTPELRHERITTLLGFVTEAFALRARLLDNPRPDRPALEHDMFVGNLVDMAVGALSAPSTTSVTA
jgi:AcrR family transcriptional regulator